MKNLRVWQKLALLVLVFVVPLAVITVRIILSMNATGIAFTHREIVGVDQVAPMLALVRELQQHRGMAEAWLAGDAAFRGRVANKGAQVLDALAAVDERRKGGADPLGTAGAWDAVRNDIRRIVAEVSKLNPAESFQRHSRLIDAVLVLIGQTADRSGLTIHPVLDGYHLVSAATVFGPELSEVLGQARGLGSRIAATDRPSPQLLGVMQELSSRAADLERRFREHLMKASAANPQLGEALQANIDQTSAAVRTALDLAAQLAAGPAADVDATAYFDATTTSIDRLFEIEERLLAEMRALLEQRFASARYEIRLTLVGAGLGLLVALLISLFIVRDITRPLHEVVGIAHRIASGDLDMASGLDTRKDELGLLAKAFESMVSYLREAVHVTEEIASGNLALQVRRRSDSDAIGDALSNMLTSLSSLVGQVQRSGIQVASSVNEIAATAKQQQATATQVAATTMEIGTTSKEISATSRELVKTVGEVSNAAEESATLAGSGQAGLTRMEDTMRQVVEAAGVINAKLAVLNEKAGNISQVVTTITKVADQTNLLSLNAAIEAEKAGEYGRGFSVVATEIRRLADQTAVATYDIEQMVKEIQSAVSAGVMGMDKFSEEVRRGLQDVQQVGTQLSQIIVQVQAMAPRFEWVNEGMQAQAAGAEQITQALSQLSESAQQTVESLRQSGQAIDGLNEVSGALRSGVSRFRLVA